MAVENEIIIIGLGIIFNYLILYQKNHFFGNIGYFALGLLLASYATDNITTGVGIFMILGSIISAVYDFLMKTQRQKRHVRA